MRTKQLTYLLLSFMLIFFTACGRGNSGDTTKDNAINKIVAYAESQGTGELPTIQDYVDAGVIGVSERNLADINEVVSGLTKEEVDTPEEIQALLDALGVSLAPTPPVPSPAPTPDTTAPVITLNAATTAVICGDTYTEAGATATDDVDGSLDVNITGTVDTDTIGSYTITYKATDNAGNEATETKIVDVDYITHNGTDYCVVTSPYGDHRVWLDRNLGASQVCTAYNDSACYGDYYQWGRNADGHEKSDSSTTITLATDINDAGTDFIIIDLEENEDEWTRADSNGSLRQANWSNTHGSSVCPVGFRVPNITELRGDTVDNGVTDRDTAFSNFLKLPSAGYRTTFSGTMLSVGLTVYVWTSSVSGTASSLVRFYSGGSDWFNGDRASGFSVRCLRIKI